MLTLPTLIWIQAAHWIQVADCLLHRSRYTPAQPSPTPTSLPRPPNPPRPPPSTNPAPAPDPAPPPAEYLSSRLLSTLRSSRVRTLGVTGLASPGDCGGIRGVVVREFDPIPRIIGDAFAVRLTEKTPPAVVVVVLGAEVDSGEDEEATVEVEVVGGYGVFGTDTGADADAE